MKPMPVQLMDIARGYWSSRVLLSAVELDLFSAVGDGATAAAAAARADTDPRATARLLRALVGLELMEHEDGRFRCTPATREFLSEGGAGDSRASVRHMANLWARWSTLTETVRRGERVIGPQRADDPAWTRAFIGAMHRSGGQRARSVCDALAGAGLLAKARRCLDLGGGSGAYSHALLAARPGLECTLFDLPAVVELAREFAAAAGVLERMRFVAGDLYAGGFGEGYDLVLVSSICHMLSAADNRDLLARLRPCLAPGGHVVIGDFFLDEDRCGPAWAALFGINMLVATGGGDSYSESDYRDWLAEGGFTEIRRLELPGPADLVVGGLN